MRYGKTILATLLILSFLSAALLARLAWAETGITRRGDGTGILQTDADTRYANVAGEDGYAGVQDLSGADEVIVPAPTKGTHAINRNTGNTDYINASGGDTLADPLGFPAGAVGAPALYGPDADSGFYFDGGGKTIKVTVDGVDKFSVASNLATFAVNGLFPVGSTTEPSIIVGDADTGFAYSAKAGGLILIVDGGARGWVSASDGIVAAGGLVLPSGTSPSPDTLGSLFLDTNLGGGDGSLVCYTASGWEVVKDFN